MDDMKLIKEELRKISETLARNTLALEHHMSRTLLNEKRIEKVENWILGILTTGVLGLIGKLLLLK